MPLKSISKFFKESDASNWKLIKKIIANISNDNESDVQKKFIKQENQNKRSCYCHFSQLVWAKFPTHIKSQQHVLHSMNGFGLRPHPRTTDWGLSCGTFGRQGMNTYSPPQPLDPWIIIQNINFFSSTVEHHQLPTPFLKMKWIPNLSSKKWIPSPPGKVRLNLDGSLNVQTAGIGGIIRTLVKPRHDRWRPTPPAV